MWNRAELKTAAKGLLKANYWKSVLVGVILAFLYTSLGSSSGNAAKDSDLSAQLSGLTDGELLTVFAVIMGIIGVALILDLLLTIFLWNPIEVGCQKFYLNCKKEKGTLRDLGFAFKNGYGHVGAVMLCRTIFNSLWYLLLIVPGIVKSYEYMMIPYILADDPTISRKDAFAKSKAMMQGNKWNAFVLDLSFLGWLILGVVTLGLLNIFFVDPYMYFTHAELYHALKKQG